VLTKNANVGDIITPFSSADDSKGAVVNMADMDTLEVEADVSEASISKIKVGMPTEIQLDAYPNVRLLGEVSRIVPTVDRAKATLLVKVAFKEKDPRVLPDMSAKVAFLARAPEAAERKPVTRCGPRRSPSAATRASSTCSTPENVAKEVAWDADEGGRPDAGGQREAGRQGGAQSAGEAAATGDGGDREEMSATPAPHLRG
jgi:multidrug efflux pump subunit AcrA (membrane-fusion protein)